LAAGGTDTIHPAVTSTLRLPATPVKVSKIRHFDAALAAR
jgi:hypothetical protein